MIAQVHHKMTYLRQNRYDQVKFFEKYLFSSPREAGCFDLGGCSISEVNKPCDGETGSVCFHFYLVYFILSQTYNATAVYFKCYTPERYQINFFSIE